MKQTVLVKRRISPFDWYKDTQKNSALSSFSVSEGHFIRKNGKKKRLPPEGESLCYCQSPVFSVNRTGFPP